MPWRTYTQVQKRFWEGDDWPDEINQQTREHAAAAGWDAGGWAACRNISSSDAVDDWLDDLPAFHRPVPAQVVTEMIDRSRDQFTADDQIRMLNALAGGWPPATAAFVAANGPYLKTADQYWEVADQLRLSGQALDGWWHAGFLQDYREPLTEQLIRKIRKRINPWIIALGPDAYLWVLAGYTLAEAKAAADAGTVTDAELRTQVGPDILLHDLNDHGMEEVEPDLELARFKAEDPGWVIREQDHRRVWTKDGWPPDLPMRTRVSCGSAGWTVQDWLRLHRAANRHYLYQWLWDMPWCRQPLDPNVVLDLINADPWAPYSVEVLNLVAAGEPARVAVLAAQRVSLPKTYAEGDLDGGEVIERILGMIGQLARGPSKPSVAVRW